MKDLKEYTFQERMDQLIDHHTNLILNSQLTIEQLGYVIPRILPTGECAAIRRMAFTYGLFVGLNSGGIRTRFCYETFEDAKRALEDWDGQGNPPGPWLKEKGFNLELGKYVDRSNPNSKKEAV